MHVKQLGMPDHVFKLLSTDTTVDDTTRTIEVICSTSAPDRIGDVIVQEGIDLTAYKANPVVLWGHDSDRPVARAEKVWVQNGQLRALAEFPPEGADPDADWVYGKVKNRLVNAVSIGFIPREWEPVDVKAPWDGYKYLESEMVEFSFVSVPMNAEALVVGRSFKLPKKREFALPSQRDGFQVVETRDFKVGGSRDLPIDESDTWDGAAAAASIFDACGLDGDSPDLAKCRRGFLIYDAAKAEQKDSYKLPFAHVVDGTMKAVKGGIRAAASRLQQTNAPEDVLTRARSVIDHYEEKMGIESEEGKALVATLRRATASLDQALARVQKAGRTLSSANEALIRQAHNSLGQVLDQLAPDAPDEPDDDADETSKNLEGDVVRTRQSNDTLTSTQRFPRRSMRQVRLLKLRSA